MATRGTAPAWRLAFLRELARGGNVALAARVCGIDRMSAYQSRKRNAAFAASWDRAVEAARARLLAGCVTTEAPACAGKRSRADQVLRSSKTGRVCIARAGPGRWSAKSEAAFLAELTASERQRGGASGGGFDAGGLQPAAAVAGIRGAVARGGGGGLRADRDAAGLRGHQHARPRAAARARQ